MPLGGVPAEPALMANSDALGGVDAAQPRAAGLLTCAYSEDSAVRIGAANKIPKESY